MIYLALGIIFPVIFNATIGLYYWGALGLMLTMRRFEQSVEAKRFLRRADQEASREPSMRSRARAALVAPPEA
jgi:hypothetical protein